MAYIDDAVTSPSAYLFKLGVFYGYRLSRVESTSLINFISVTAIT